MHTRHGSLTTLIPPERVTFERQVAEGFQSPGLHPFLSTGRDDLYPRFARYHEHLRRLPRRARRALQRQWKRSLSAIALLLALGQAPALAATITVSGGCTLVDAIKAANTDARSKGCTAGSGAADTLVLAAGSIHTLTKVEGATGYGATGLPLVTSTVTIEGNGSTIVRGAGAPKFRLLALGSGANLTLEDLTLTGGFPPYTSNGGGVANRGGTLTLSNCNISGNTAYQGGGIFSQDGSVILTNTTVSSNSATGYVGGGGIANGGSLILTDSTVSGNSAAGGYGIGIASSGAVTLTNTTISGNTGRSRGAISNIGTITLTDSTVSDNSAYFGGTGVVSRGGTVTLANSTVSGNTAHFGAGGVWMINGGVLTLANSTVSGNSTLTYGGGVDNIRGTVTLTNSTVSGNTADSFGGGLVNRIGGTLILNQSVVSGNVAPISPEVHNIDVGSYPGTAIANNFNVFGSNGDAGVVGVVPGPTDIIPAPGVYLTDILDPLLADNGGPTKTHALVSGSPAVDAVHQKRCPPPFTDQRGFPRPVDGGGNPRALCDIGAFELGADGEPPSP